MDTQDTSEPGRDQPAKGFEPPVFSQQFQHPSVSARVPERVGKGVFATGVIVQDSPEEFCLDFLQGLAQPRQVVARIIMAPGMMNQLLNAIRDNLQRYERNFGPPPVLPKPRIDRRPTIQEIYDELKLPEDLLSGVYANAVMIGHSPAEFFLDFITRFYPTAAVSCRVYVTAPQMPRMLETLSSALGQYHKRMEAMRQQQMRPPQPPDGPPAEQ